MKKIDRDKFEQTYGLFKFKLPTKDEQSSAMDLVGESNLFKKMISLNFERFYDDLVAPDIGDWLMMHKEYGQTYMEYVRSGAVTVKTNKDVIYLAPLYCEANDIDVGFLNALQMMCEAYFYGMKIKILNKKIDLNNYSIEVRIYDENKIQLSANQILSVLYSELPDDAYCLVGFTAKDLFNDHNVIKARDYIYNRKNTGKNFCYGLSSLKNRVSVFTFARYDPLFYVTIKKDSEKEQEFMLRYYFVWLKRACKVIVNDILHLFGLKNCTFFRCILNGFNTMDEFDKRPLELCPICLRKLYAAICLKGYHDLRNARVCNPDLIYQRFVKMKDFLSENFEGIFDFETAWYKARIQDLDKEL
jgi:archaemetzincin